MKQKIIDEAWRMGGIFVYLAMFFCGFTTYRRLMQTDHRSALFAYGYCLFEALVLAKVCLIGDLLRVGKRFSHMPLIVSTLYRSLSFCVFVLGFTLLEHSVEAIIHGEGLTSAWHAIWSNKAEVFARVVVMGVTFIPMFAIWETAGVMGEDKFFDLFFKRRP